MTKLPNLPFFVYGTLLPGHSNYKRLFHTIKPQREAPDTLHGHVLIGNKGSPFPYLADARDLPKWAFEMVPEDDMLVTGQLLYFSDEDFPKILAELDWLEGVPDHYNRKQVTVGANFIEAYTYYAEKWLVDALLPYPFVPNGDWNAFYKPKTRNIKTK